MPQMAPISWLTLFFMFFLTFIMFNISNYFIYNPLTPSHKQKNTNIFSMSWKW